VSDYEESTGVVAEIEGERVHLDLDDGGRRSVACPLQIEVSPGMRVRLLEFEDDSAPIVVWGLTPATVRKLYVRLLGEGVEVWRPVRGLEETADVYRILSKPSPDEEWEFASDSTVRCQYKTFSDGSDGLVAIEPA
jgi:hypothetical protein